MARISVSLAGGAGLALGAIGDNELAAAIFGVDIYRIKLGVYAAAARHDRRAAGLACPFGFRCSARATV